MDSERRIVVVGAGLAGWRTCTELRDQGFAGEVVLVGEEPDPPYDRPPLSKGEVGPGTGDLGVDPAAYQVEFRPATRAVGLQGASALGDRELGVALADGEVVPADAVVVACGAEPIVPAGWVLGPRVRTLRTRVDAIALGRLIDEVGAGGSFAVLGGSWIGLELTSRLAAAGVACRVFERAAWLAPHLPPEIGRQVRRWAEAAGVQVELGLPVTEVVADADQVRVTTPAEVVVADAALVALGVRPATGWLTDAGLRLAPSSAALRVSAQMASSDPRVVGVGDVTQRWAPRYQTWLAGGHWQDALDAPPVAAATVLAVLRGEAPTRSYDAVPYFWSELFGHTVQWTGYLTDHRAARLVVRGSITDDLSWSVCWLDEQDRLRALLACDAPRDAVAARKAQAADPQGAPVVDVAALEDPGVPLRATLVTNR